MKTITFKIDNQGVHFREGGVIDWSKTNLPAETFRFRERETIYWALEMLSYDKDSGQLNIRVVDFEVEASDFQPNRKMKSPVTSLDFALLDGEAFKAQLAYYQAGPLALFLEAAPARQTSLAPAAAALLSEAEAAEKKLTVLPPLRRVLRFSHPLLELTFGNGGVKGIANLSGIAEPLSFAISNDHIVAEFDNIKPFFVRVLKRKTIDVNAVLTFPEGEPRLTEMSSPQIDRINNDMLELFRARGIRNLLSPDRMKTVDKSLFTPEDIFESLDDDALGKATLPQDGHDLLAEILRHKKVRNAHQLTFLASSLHRAEHKLRFVLSPKFGFVFTTEGQEGRHFILELLDSNATYIWTLPLEWRTLDEQFRAVEKEIAAIASIGRGQYRRTLDFEHEFWFVIHESADSALVDGFPRWKNRLLEGLV